MCQQPAVVLAVACGKKEEEGGRAAAAWCGAMGARCVARTMVAMGGCWHGDAGAAPSGRPPLPRTGCKTAGCLALPCSS